MWNFLNRSKKDKSIADYYADMRDWGKHFKELLDGSEERCTGEGRNLVLDENNESHISVSKIKEIWSMLKKKKAAEMDKIPNEVWIYRGRDLINKLICIMGRVWKEEGLPEDWKTSVIVPLYK